MLCPSFSCPYSSSLMTFPSVFCSVSSVDFYCYNSSYFQVVALEFAVCISISTHWINIILSLYNVNTLRNQNLFILFVFSAIVTYWYMFYTPHYFLLKSQLIIEEFLTRKKNNLSCFLTYILFSVLCVHLSKSRFSSGIIYQRASFVP